MNDCVRTESFESYFAGRHFNLNRPRTPLVADTGPLLIPTHIGISRLPLRYAGGQADERRRRAIEALASVGLGNGTDHKSNELSGGQ